ncbi:MAG: transcriptional regulator [Planctomycetota bacterium]|nr:MAG: transcriptional regulator [Planctomycetota bacterium]
MYNPNHFKITDTELIESFISQNPFATVISIKNESPIVSHIPINRFSNGRLYGHMANSNPHSQIEDNSTITAIFSGPHAYISPNYYKSEFNVPTWNYSSVHCCGKLKFVNDKDAVWELFNEMVSIYEGAEGWRLPNETKFKNLFNAIQFFYIESPEFEAKFKFNQNKSVEDIESVIDSLEANGENEVAKLMRECTNG